MIGLLWNIRGLGKLGRVLALISRIKDSHADFIGIMETKKNSISVGFLKTLSSNVPFCLASFKS